ncbi:helix-turn-helix domain-containing protein [Piscinibacter sp. XHJ-5]|uniref:TetR/AcrR family transcriptional regulator n=1 Tax=Piscinibacter sp. XHJ-5 TaxID=3037797 RepID=UPI002452D85C|nr:helix-turn-helix domain-containing protein [Piscinibacter sp. XHJ-5]
MSQDSRSSRPTRRRRSHARPAELLDAACEVFGEKGYAAARTEEIAELAGVSKGTLYRYYPSKEELFKAAISRARSKTVVAGVLPVVHANAASADVLHRVLAELWSQLAGPAGAGAFRMLLTDVRRFPDVPDLMLRTVMEPGRALIGEVVRKGMNRGEFRPLNPDVVALSALAPIIMMCLQMQTNGDGAASGSLADGASFVRQHVELVLQGLQAD